MLVMPKRGGFEQTHGHRRTPGEPPSPLPGHAREVASARVLVVEGRDIPRAGILALLDREEAFDVVGVARSVEEACRLLGSMRPALAPDVVLIGSPPSGRHAGLVLRTIRSRIPDAALVALLTAIDAPTLAACLTSGARAVVRADRPAADVAGAVRLAAEGSTYLDRAASPFIPEAIRQAEPGVQKDELTGREIATLGLIGSGSSNHQIARQLGVSHGTVKATIQSVLRKLGAQNRTAAVTAVLRMGVIGLQPQPSEPSEGDISEMPAPDRPLEGPPSEDAAMLEGTRILVFSGESLLAEGVASVLDCSTDLAAEIAGEVRTAIGWMESAPPGALVIAGRVAHASALTVLQAAADRRVPAILVGSYDPEEADSLMHAGIVAHLGDDVFAAVLLDAVRSALMLDILPASPQGREAVRVSTEADLIAQLSEGERTLLALLARGLSNAAIAAELESTVPAVKGLCARLFHRLGIRNRAEAAAIALRNKIG